MHATGLPRRAHLHVHSAAPSNDATASGPEPSAWQTITHAILEQVVRLLRGRSHLAFGLACKAWLSPTSEPVAIVCELDALHKQTCWEWHLCMQPTV